MISEIHSYSSLTQMQEFHRNRFVRLAYRAAFHSEPNPQTIAKYCDLLKLCQIDHIQLIRKLQKDAELIFANHLKIDADPMLDIDTLILRIRSKIISNK